MKFLHTADWQLGMTRHFLGAEAQPRYTAARQEAIGAIGKIAQEQACEFVVVCGDVFDDNQLPPMIVARALEAMRSIAVPVYLLPGNHDPLDAVSIYRSPGFLQAKPDHVHVLDTPGLVEIRPGVELVVAPWTNKAPLEDLVGVQLTELSATEGIRIVVGHGGVDQLDPDPTKPALVNLETIENALAQHAIHYVALGDKHSRTQVGSTGRVWYSGSPEVTNYNNIEAAPGDVLVVELNEPGGVDIIVTEHRVGRWAFNTIVRDVNGVEDIALLEQALEQLPNKHETVVQLVLAGTVTVSQRAMLEKVLEKFTNLFASLNFWDRHTDLAVISSDGEFSDLGLSGFAAEAVGDLSVIAQSSDIGQAKAAQGALSLLYRLSGGGTQ
ncbi:MAG: metallophosphoesterase family protein [Mycobacteriaceae bacterium]